MRWQNRNICLLVDNFSGHFVDYKPRNIHLECFEPNLTSYVQPCDAGIIRTTKALYRTAFCLRAMELDDAGRRDIFCEVNWHSSTLDKSHKRLSTSVQTETEVRNERKHPIRNDHDYVRDAQHVHTKYKGKWYCRDREFQHTHLMR